MSDIYIYYFTQVLQTARNRDTFSISRDSTVGKVMVWIDALDYHVQIVKINDTASNNTPTFRINENQCSLGSSTLNINGQLVELDNRTNVWYRNGTLLEYLLSPMNISKRCI